MTANYERTLVTRALELVGESSNVYAAEVLGVSEGTIRRWRAGDISTPLRTGTRVGLIRYIEEREGGQTAPPPEDEWSRFSLGMVRHAGGSRPMTEDERTLVQTDVADVAAGWRETATWTLTGNWYIRRLVVLTRNPGSIQFRETDRYEIR
jgi:hypothetical protein